MNVLFQKKNCLFSLKLVTETEVCIGSGDGKASLVLYLWNATEEKEMSE